MIIRQSVNTCVIILCCLQVPTEDILNVVISCKWINYVQNFEQFDICNIWTMLCEFHQIITLYISVFSHFTAQYSQCLLSLPDSVT